MRVNNVGGTVGCSRGHALGAAPQGCVAELDGWEMDVMETWVTGKIMPALEVLAQPPRLRRLPQQEPPRLQRPPQQVKYENGQT